MCNACSTRRGFVSALTLGIAAIPTVTLANTETPTLTPDEALAKLMAGNAKYVASPELCEATELQERRSATAKGQSPYAVILTCADSRVPPELIFGGAALGELFVIRNAGNVAEVGALGSIEYALEHLHSPLVVVMGHERCGAVTAAVNVVTKNEELPGFIKPMVAPIEPAVVTVRDMGGDMVENAVRENARMQAEIILTKSKIVAEHVKAGKVKVMHGHYDLDSGEVVLMAASTTGG